MPRGYIPAWASRGLSLAINGLLMMQVTCYCTGNLGLGIGLVGVLLLGARLVDGLTDLIVGCIIIGSAVSYRFAVWHRSSGS